MRKLAIPLVFQGLCGGVRTFAYKMRQPQLSDVEGRLRSCNRAVRLANARYVQFPCQYPRLTILLDVSVDDLQKLSMLPRVSTLLLSCCIMAGMILKGASFVTGAARIASLQTVCGGGSVSKCFDGARLGPPTECISLTCLLADSAWIDRCRLCTSRQV